METLTYIWNEIINFVFLIPVSYYMNALLFIGCVMLGSKVIQFMIKNQAINLFRYLLNSFLVLSCYFIITGYLPQYATIMKLNFILKLLTVYGIWTLIVQVRRQRKLT